MIKAVVTGASYGGMEAIKLLVTELSSAGITVPVIAVLHIGNNNIHTYLSSLNSKTGFVVKEASEKETIAPGTVYFAPPNYHLQVENNFTFSLSTDKKVNFSRPSIDVLFETAAWTFRENLLGVLLTGSNNDGARGLKTIKDYGGTTIVENPETAHGKTMPRSATELFTPDYILDLSDIAAKIVELCR
jgi:two-component system, chemotaxis family, protein-glutamate methylesterase/glutaminase